MSLRTASHWCASAWCMACPCHTISPAVAGIRFRMPRARVDLPQPDSPTMPRVSPCIRSNETPSTALRIFLGSQAQALSFLTLKYTFRPRTERMGCALDMAQLLRGGRRELADGPVAGTHHLGLVLGADQCRQLGVAAGHGVLAARRKRAAL